MEGVAGRRLTPRITRISWRSATLRISVPHGRFREASLTGRNEPARGERIEGGGRWWDPSLAADAREIADRLGDRNRSFAGATVLLTGAAGFLGTQFCHYFRELNAAGRLDRPCRLLAYDSFARGRPAWVEAFRAAGDAEVVASDVVTQRDYPAADYVIHAASIASPTFYRRHPIATMDANVQGLRNLLDHAVGRRPRSFLVFSTSEIYGDPDPAHVPTPETYRGSVSCTGPRACYDESKRYGETLAVNFHAEYGLPVKVARPFNNYGPGP